MKKLRDIIPKLCYVRKAENYAIFSENYAMLGKVVVTWFGDGWTDIQTEGVYRLAPLAKNSLILDIIVGQRKMNDYLSKLGTSVRPNMYVCMYICVYKPLNGLGSNFQDVFLQTHSFASSQKQSNCQ